MVYRPVTTASFLRLCLSPLPKHTCGLRTVVRTIGTPLPSACTTEISLAGDMAGGLLRMRRGFDIAGILGHQITDGLRGEFQAQDAGKVAPWHRCCPRQGTR